MLNLKEWLRSIIAVLVLFCLLPLPAWAGDLPQQSPPPAPELPVPALVLVALGFSAAVAGIFALLQAHHATLQAEEIRHLRHGAREIAERLDEVSASSGELSICRAAATALRALAMLCLLCLLCLPLAGCATDTQGMRPADRVAAVGAAVLISFLIWCWGRWGRLEP